MLFVISAPSGTGKTTVIRNVLKRFPDLVFSVSATSRPKRPGETDGVDYYFLSPQRFEEAIRNNELVEWEQIYGNYYGTLRKHIDETLARGKHMLFDIDVKGALSIRKLFPDDSVLIFLQPPSLEELRKRLEKRGTDSEEVIATRLERARMEMELAESFDYVVTNDDLEKTLKKVYHIIESRLTKAGITNIKTQSQS